MIKRNFTCKTCLLTNLFLVVLLVVIGLIPFSQESDQAKMGQAIGHSAFTASKPLVIRDCSMATGNAGTITNNTFCFYVVESRLTGTYCFADSRPLYKGLELTFLSPTVKETVSTHNHVFRAIPGNDQQEQSILLPDNSAKAKGSNTYCQTINRKNTFGLSENHINAGQHSIRIFHNCLLPTGILAAISQPEGFSGFYFMFPNAFEPTAKEAGAETYS